MFAFMNATKPTNNYEIVFNSILFVSFIIICRRWSYPLGFYVHVTQYLKQDEKMKCYW